MGRLPGLCVLPAGVSGVVEMQKQPFPAIKKAKAEEIVPDKRKPRDDEDMPPESRAGVAGLSFVDGDLRTQRAVPVDVLDVAFDGGIGVVNQVVSKLSELAVEDDGLVNGPLGEADGRSKVRRMATEET